MGTDTASENKTAAQSLKRSRRRHWLRFSASVPLRLRLLRQRRGVADFHRAAPAPTAKRLKAPSRPLI
jgi:hypothetical protein